MQMDKDPVNMESRHQATPGKAPGQGEEESLLEQIRLKEEELQGRIASAEREASEHVTVRHQEAQKWLESQQKEVEAEADKIWTAAMETVGTESSRVRKEGDERIQVQRERKKHNFDAAVDLVVNAVKPG
jgi:vacuolar-type H+-ATPase subunit H